MKRLLVSLILALSLALPAAAQVVEDPSTGASISSGSTISGCNAITAILNVVTGALTCNPASVVNGTVSTAGRSILTIQDTISGSSATSNFLNITGTFPATLSAATNGVVISLTGDNDAQTQRGLDLSLTPSTGNQSFTAFRSALAAGNSGVGNMYAGEFTNAVTGGGAIPAIAGVRASVTGAASGHTAGVYGESTGASAKGFGVIGLTSAGTARFGVAGFAAGGTDNMGGYFSLESTFAAPTGNAALVANNAAVAANIFEARDNGTAVFTIADGGTITATNVLNMGGNGIGLALTSAGAAIANATGPTPDTAELMTGTFSNSFQINEIGDYTYDFQNACTTGLGTSICTDPTLIVHSHNQDTGEFLSMAHDGKAGVIVGGNSTVLDGTIRLGGTVTLTESSATSVLTVPVAVSTGTGGEIMYTVEAKDATNTQVRRGSVRYAVANNSSGTETCGVYGVDNAATVNPAETNDGSGAGAITSGTLTYAWTSDTTGTNQCVLKLNGVSSLTQTTFQIHYTVIQSGPGVPTGGD